VTVEPSRVCVFVCGIICIAVRPADAGCSFGVIDSYLYAWFEHFGADFVFHSFARLLTEDLLLFVDSVSDISLLLSVCFYVKLILMNCERIKLSYAATSYIKTTDDDNMMIMLISIH